MKSTTSILSILLLAILYSCFPAHTPNSNKIEGETHGYHPQAEAEMMMTYVDPATGKIPVGIRPRELAYVKTLPKRTDLSFRDDPTPPIRWHDAGPANVGGRTRALAFDRSNPQTILAGGATGGIWKSTDEGDTWQLKSEPGSHLNVTTLAQDPRPEHSQTWYYGTGELRGESGWDRGYIARNYGTGIYKSTDNGETWTVIPSTVPGNETTWDGAFDFTHKIAISPTTGTRFIANNGSGIYRSTDDENFPRVLGATSQHLYNDVAVGSDGRLVAVLSSLRTNWTHTATGGVFVSTNDGLNWQEITPATFPTQHHRSLVAFAPSNPDIVYVLTYTGNLQANNREDIRFHYLNLADGTSEDRTAFLPNFFGTNPFTGPALHSLGSYCMALGVHPEDEDFVVIGGNALYRSTNGFSAPIPANQALTIIGGYQDVSGQGFPHKYPNHWVDQHVVVFHPEQPQEMWNGNDSGIYRTLDITAESVVWDDKSRGYNTIQYFFVTMGSEAGDTRILGGAQDNGTIYFQDTGTIEMPRFTDGLEICSGDGSYGYFGKNYAYTSLQNGRARRADYFNEEQTNIQTHLSFQLVNVAPPPAANTSNMFYIHPYIIDPNDEKTMYFPESNFLWRNTNIEAVNPLNSWTQLSNIAAPQGYTITDLAVSQFPAHVLYFGATHGNQPPKVYRLENANTAFLGAEDISIPNTPVGAYVHDIAIHPENADEVMVVLSNYNITGLYHSSDGGENWRAVEGNLTGNNAFNPGPSIRCAAMLPLSFAGLEGTIYLVGTSAGLFSTSTLEGSSVIWEQEAFAEMGNAIAEMIYARPADGRIAVGTFGRGIFIGDVDLDEVGTDVVLDGKAPVDVRVFPNPAGHQTTVQWTMHHTDNVSLGLFDLQGRLMRAYLFDTKLAPGRHQKHLTLNDLDTGVYVLRLEMGGNTMVTKLVIK